MNRKIKRPVVEIVIALFLALLSAALVLIQDISIPTDLKAVVGDVISRDPIYSSKGHHLTGFRFCLDTPRLTFTYPDSGPRVKEIWALINQTDRVRVLYEAHEHANPTLWGLEIGGHPVVSSDELRSGRINELLTWLLVFVASVAYAIWAWQTPKRLASEKPDESKDTGFPLSRE